MELRAALSPRNGIGPWAVRRSGLVTLAGVACCVPASHYSPTPFCICISDEVRFVLCYLVLYASVDGVLRLEKASVPYLYSRLCDLRSDYHVVP